jgi:hypothetical protein
VCLDVGREVVARLHCRRRWAPSSAPRAAPSAAALLVTACRRTSVQSQLSTRARERQSRGSRFAAAASASVRMRDAPGPPPSRFSPLKLLPHAGCTRRGVFGARVESTAPRHLGAGRGCACLAPAAIAALASLSKRRGQTCMAMALEEDVVVVVVRAEHPLDEAAPRWSRERRCSWVLLAEEPRLFRAGGAGPRKRAPAAAERRSALEQRYGPRVALAAQPLGPSAASRLVSLRRLEGRERGSAGARNEASPAALSGWKRAAVIERGCRSGRSRRSSASCGA